MLENSVSGEKAAGDVVISVSHVCKTYKLYPSHQDRLKEALHPFRKRYHEEFSALNDVSFEIRRGESVGILGRNGAGKSTLLQLIAGVLNPTSGTVRVAGTISALLELGAGFNPDLTGRENVLLANTIQGADEKEITERVSLVESFADIGLFFDQPMKVYSSGMYARVAFAHAINVNPNVLIVDEILGVGDAKFQNKCHHKISELKSAGVTIIFVSHDSAQILRNCERCLVLNNGMLLMFDGTEYAVSFYNQLLQNRAVDNVSDKSKFKQGQGHVRQGAGGISSGVYSKKHLETPVEMKSIYNKYERRSGERKIEIVAVSVLSDGMYDQMDLVAGRRVKMVLVIRARQMFFDCVSVGFAVNNVNGLNVYGTNTFLLSGALMTIDAMESKTVCFDFELNTGGGDLFMDLSVATRDAAGLTFQDRREAVFHFCVSPARSFEGFSDFKCKTSILCDLASKQ